MRSPDENSGKGITGDESSFLTQTGLGGEFHPIFRFALPALCLLLP
jgi:hypothetical protein